MIKLKTIIVDDEPLALRLLSATLLEFPEIDIVAQCCNGREAVERVLQCQPDLLFLDIQMPGMNGFDVLRALPEDRLPLIIFSTAYERYAINAFDHHAVDYVLKPVSENRLEKAVQRAVERFQSREIIGGKTSAVMDAIKSISEGEKQQGVIESENNEKHPTLESISGKLAIKDAHTVTLVAEADISWVDAAGDYMCIHACGKTHIMRSTMKELMAKLDSQLFKRVHRSTIVNLTYIEKIKPHTKGEYFLFLLCGERIKVSRNYKDEIKSLL